MTIKKKKLEPLFDEFVHSFGDERVDRLILEPSNSKRADYYFHKYGVLAELKRLENDSFGPEYKQKMDRLTKAWLQKGLIKVFGTVQIGLRDIPRECQLEWMSVIERPLQKKVIEAANAQIRATKQLLKIPDTRGVILVASDGNYSLEPYDVLYTLNRILQKKKGSGELQYSSIQGICYFSANMLATTPKLPAPAIFWCGGPRDSADLDTKVFCDDLGTC
jgi:hypothetical protein